MNHYTFDRIEEDSNGCLWGYLGKHFVEVFGISADDTIEVLEGNGFAYCSSPSDTELFIVLDVEYKAIPRL